MSSLVLGASRLGSGDLDAAVATAEAMLLSGHLIDTSRNYADGASERALGMALTALPSPQRADAASRVITKVDADPDTGALDAARVFRSVEESLAALGVERVPLLHLHDPYTVTADEALARGGAVDALLRLRDEGVAAAIGIAAGPLPLVGRYVDSGAFDAVLSHNRFTLIDSGAADLFDDARSRGMTVFNAAPFGGDLLARGPRPGARYAYRPIDEALTAWTSALFRVCEAHDVPAASVALRFSTRSPLVDHTVVGVSGAARLAELQALDRQPIPEVLWAELDELGPAPSPFDGRRDA